MAHIGSKCVLKTITGRPKINREGVNIREMQRKLLGKLKHMWWGQKFDGLLGQPAYNCVCVLLNRNEAPLSCELLPVLGEEDEDEFVKYSIH